MMSGLPLAKDLSVDLQRQQQLVDALRASGLFLHLPNVKETHISWVLLTGYHAYKIKKAVDLGFLDFSTLELRRFYCDEELRLNRRLAPDLYLGVVAIGGTPEQPLLGPVPVSQPAIEYAVHMRRFLQSRMMNCMLTHGLVSPAHIDKLAEIIAGFHRTLPPAAADSPYSATSAIELAAEQNFIPLLKMLVAPGDLAMLKAVHAASTLEFATCEPLFRQRATEGYIRECHGDLHLGNIVLLGDAPTPFDCIEFSAALRWIDVISEISFTVMDLLRRGQPQLAWRLLNAYLECSGDFSGIGVLRFYLGYRAMVRAKIAVIRAHQRGTRIKKELKSCLGYLRLAHSCLTKRRPALVITHGLPGCGKSTVAQIALERLGAIRIRSDVERKRLFGLTPLANSKTQTGTDIYSEEATQRTYARLQELARGVLSAGFPVIVDAAFILHSERDSFRALARELGVPFVIASVQSNAILLAERLALRSKQGNDASEADLTVLKKLQTFQEPLNSEELNAAVTFVNDGNIAALQSADAAWKSLEAYLV